MDGESQCGTHAQHRSEGVGAGAQVRFLAQEFERVPFFLQRVCFVGGAEHCQFFGLHFHALSFALGCHERAFYVDGRTRGDGFQLLVAKAVHVEHNLQVADGRSVVQCHELHVLVASARAHPTHHVDVVSSAGEAKISDILVRFIECRNVMSVIRKSPSSDSSLPPV